MLHFVLRSSVLFLTFYVFGSCTSYTNKEDILCSTLDLFCVRVPLSFREYTLFLFSSVCLAKGHYCSRKLLLLLLQLFRLGEEEEEEEEEGRRLILVQPISRPFCFLVQVCIFFKFLWKDWIACSNVHGIDIWRPARKPEINFVKLAGLNERRKKNSFVD